MSRLDEALALHEQLNGRLVPTSPNKEPNFDVLKTVHGRPPAWRPFREEPPSRDHVKAWFDVDADGVSTTITTPTVDTPRPGRHFWSEHPGVPTPTTPHARGEILGDGVLAVVPPSTTPKGSYDWHIGPDAPLAPFNELLDDLDLSGPTAQGVQPTQGVPSTTSERIFTTNPVALLGSVVLLGSSEFLKAIRDPDRRKRVLTEVDSDPGLLTAWAHTVSVPHEALPFDGQTGRKFLCVLHDENHPSASLWLGKEGAFLYSDHHRNGTQRTYTLTQVYAFRAAGCEWKMEPSEHARQKLRMLIDLGLVEPPEIELPPLPTDADPALMWGYDRLRLLLQARALGEDVSEPFPLTQRFFARWCVSGEAVARRVIRDLRRSGVIIKVGEFPSAFGRPMALYLPGHLAPGESP